MKELGVKAVPPEEVNSFASRVQKEARILEGQ
jgi:hypothetical protein